MKNISQFQKLNLKKNNSAVKNLKELRKRNLK